jgi:hypothetical protein
MEGKRTQGQAQASERQERIARGRRRERTEISRGREKEIETTQTRPVACFPQLRRAAGIISFSFSVQTGSSLSQEIKTLNERVLVHSSASVTQSLSSPCSA